MEDLGHGITAVDTGLVRPRFDASHIILRDGRAGFVDTGTRHSVPLLLGALERLGIAAEQVDYVFLTHIHLDHAGGAGDLIQHLSRARVVVHPRGARHLVAPERLVEGTRAVYGEAVFARYYGGVRPISEKRIVTVEDGERLRLGGSTLSFLHTPGHALHHLCIVDHDARGIFAGDTFGISYRDLDTAAGEFIFPATTPVHFDPEAAHASIDRLLAQHPQAIYLTHYSRVTDLERLTADLHHDLDVFVRIAERCGEAPDRLAALKAAMREHLAGRLAAHGFEGSVDELLGIDIGLNCQGLLVWLDRAQGR